MDSMSIFTQNLYSMVRMLGKNEGGALLELPSGAVAAASGYPSAGENYFLLAQNTPMAEVCEALRFFNERSLSFVAPILFGESKEAAYTLEENGILKTTTYTAMTLALQDFDFAEPEQTFVRASTPDQILAWGQTVWEGFGGEGGVDEPYSAFVRHMAASPQNDLYLLYCGRDAVCCGLLHHGAGKNCGLYYFATKPAFRRKGFARQLMDGMVREAARGFSELLLLATPEGLPFYKSYGFLTLADVPIHSSSSDV